MKNYNNSSQDQDGHGADLSGQEQEEEGLELRHGSREETQTVQRVQQAFGFRQE